MSEWLLVASVALVILVGILGTIVPVLPGLLLSWGAVLAYGLVRGFGVMGTIVMVVATVLLIGGTYYGFRIPQRQATDLGASRGDQLVALALGVVGFFVVPVVGLPLGYVLGIYLGRWRATNDGAEAWASTKVILVSILKATGVQALCGVAMGMAWAVWVIARNI